MLFFDLDGTLLDSNGVWLDIDIEFLGRQGISPVPADYTDYVAHHGAPDAARYTKERFGLPHSPQEILDAWMELDREAYTHTLPLKPGVKEFLLRCHEGGERMAVLTSCMPPLCQAALERHGLLPLLECVITTRELGLEKRDPALYRCVAEKMGVEGTNCLLFEDAPDYCSAACQAGWSVAGVSDPLFGEREEELKTVCRYWVETFSCLPEGLEKHLFLNAPESNERKKPSIAK